VSLFLVTETTDFHLTKGTPSFFEASEVGASAFCSRCGSQLYFTNREGSRISVAHGTLDAPECIEPRIHQWTQNAMPWLQLRDDLPRCANGKLPHPHCR
jgi:hypothetical protein